MFRSTVDLQPVSRFTVKHQYPIPNIEQELCKLSSACFFATFDLSHGYWQLPLSECSQECHSFVTLDKVYRPTWVPHGTTNAVIHQPSTVWALPPSNLTPVVLWWLNDIPIHTPSVSVFIKAVKEDFRFCAKFNFKHHSAKCAVLPSTICWCGQGISAERVWFGSSGLKVSTRCMLFKRERTYNNFHVQCNGCSRESPSSPLLSAFF